MRAQGWCRAFIEECTVATLERNFPIFPSPVCMSCSPEGRQEVGLSLRDGVLLLRATLSSFFSRAQECSWFRLAASRALGAFIEELKFFGK